MSCPPGLRTQLPVRIDGGRAEQCPRRNEPVELRAAMLTSQASSRAADPAFRLVFSGASVVADAGFPIQAPWLAGAPDECLFPGAVALPVRNGIHVFQDGGLLLGYARAPLGGDELAAGTELLYRRVLNLCGQRHLYRVWNYVPAINLAGPAGESYREFCRGRAHAFEAAMGQGFESRLPAASAVGSRGDELALVFIAGEAAPRHVENPEQVPAYRYPIEHGPRSPSFARATVVRDGARMLAFISGTAAIKGHQTVAPGALDAQIDCTLDNLRLISRQAGLGDDLGASRVVQRHFKIYLRHARDLAATRSRLEPALVQPSDVVTYLHSDICRAALNIEIEATLVS